MPNNNSNNNTASLSWNDVVPHLKTCLFITGSFCIAWSWDLVAYGAAHAWNDENPMRPNDQLGFGDPYSPKRLPFLLLQYLLVVGLTCVLAYLVKQRCYTQRWCAAALLAMEFFPAPFFSGKLMAYLQQFKHLSSLDQGLLNLLATAFAAFVAHAVQTTNEQQWNLPRPLHRFRHVLCETLWFGLGVAWNVFLMACLAPPAASEMTALHFAALLCYLLVVFLLALRFAALAEQSNNNNNDNAPPSLLARTWSMLSFAFNVVSAFTLVAFVRALIVPGWVGDFVCLVLLVLLAAILSAAVATIQVAPSSSSSSTQQQRQRGRRSGKNQPPTNDVEQGPAIGFGSGSTAVDALVFIPCLWCTCPWLPLAWILAGLTPQVHVVEKWQTLVAFVLGLATSIQASGMLTQTTNALAVYWNIGNAKHCPHPWVFVTLQVGLAVVTTIVLLAALQFVSDPVVVTEQDGVALPASSAGERQPLLQRVRKLLPKFSRRSSSISQ